MSHILSGTGSSLVHALSVAGATGLANKKIVNHSLARDTTGSTTVAFTIASDDRVPNSTLYSGTGSTITHVLSVAGVSAITNPQVVNQNVVRDSTGSVHAMFTVTTDPRVVPATIYSGTGSTVTHALSVAGVSAVTNPRVVYQTIARDSLGSVTVVFGITSDSRAAN